MRRRLPVGRFQVMATLQAARAYVLGHPIETAKSFGLNRAIFYAAAKKGFKKKEEVRPPKEIKLKKPIPSEKAEEIRRSFKIFYMGDEMAYSVELEGKRFFMIGGEVQTPEDFERQIESRFRGHFDEAWQEALELVRSVDRGVLFSQRYFFDVVYKPRRDELAEKWSRLAKKEED
jgi:hypothetical protein